MRRGVLLGLLLLVAGACSTVPERAYYPAAGAPETRRLAETLWRAAKAASEDPRAYSFAMIRSNDVSAFTVDDATFYFTQGLARQPAAVVDALVAHEVAHELLGHMGERRVLSLSLGAGFTALGFAIPGLGLIDLVANPLIVRAYTREQELAADRRAIEILRDMGYEAPRRAMAAALRAAAAINGPPQGGWLSPEPKLETRLAALEPLELEPLAAK